MKSKAYVRGYWWGTFGRLLLIQILLFLFFWLIGFVFAVLKIPQAGSLATGLLSWVISPLIICFLYLLYSNLRQLKGSFVFEPKGKGKFIFFGWLGTLIGPIGFITAVVLVSLSSARAKSRDAFRVMDVRQIQTMVELYRYNNSYYPKTLDEAKSDKELLNYIIPTDPITHVPYSYRLIDNGQEYEICFKLETQGDKCVGSKLK